MGHVLLDCYIVSTLLLFKTYKMVSPIYKPYKSLYSCESFAYIKIPANLLSGLREPLSYLLNCITIFTT